MKKQFMVVGLSCLLSLAMTAVAWAYNPGQRTYNLVGNLLNSAKQPVHVELVQQVDKAKILKPEAYALLEDNEKRLTHIAIYNEVSEDLYGQRVLSKDGMGTVVKDMSFILRDGHFYIINNLEKTYDCLPFVPGLSKSFTQGLLPWFNEKPEAGVDEVLSADYDQFTLGKRSLKMYFHKDTDQWLGYQVGNLALQQVRLYNQAVDESALALPTEEYKLVPNAAFRRQAERLLDKK